MAAIGAVEIFRGLIALTCVLIPATGAFIGHQLRRTAADNDRRHGENRADLQEVAVSVRTLTGELRETREDFKEFRGSTSATLQSLVNGRK